MYEYIASYQTSSPLDSALGHSQHTLSLKLTLITFSSILLYEHTYTQKVQYINKTTLNNIKSRKQENYLVQSSSTPIAKPFFKTLQNHFHCSQSQNKINYYNQLKLFLNCWNCYFNNFRTASKWKLFHM